ncbi:MAG: substrate-binding periplasmic protein [Paracoccaceae bacterium]
MPERLVVLSAKGLEPLAGPDLPDGGLIGALVRASVSEKDRAIGVNLAFVNDRRAHLDVLLPMGQFAMSYPWLAPDCTEEFPPGSMSEEVCGAFLFSVPIFQIEMRIFVRAEGPLRDSKKAADWKGKILCRPGGFVAVDLERRFDLRRIVSEADADACWIQVREGRADGVSIPAPLVYSAPVPDGFVEIEDLRSYEPIHAVLHKAYPGSESVLELLNSGVRELQQSGAWFELVSAYLSEFNLDKSARTTGDYPKRSQ